MFLIFHGVTCKAWNTKISHCGPLKEKFYLKKMIALSTKPKVYYE